MRILGIASAVLLAACPMLGGDYVTGVVRSKNGQVLPGVSVMAGTLVGTTTDSNGSFRIRRFGRVYFFQLKEYQPVTVVLGADQNELEVRMEDAQGKTWAVPNCNGEAGDRSVGSSLKFVIPKRSKIRTTTDVDYGIHWVNYPHGEKRDWLALWSGPTVSNGHPLVERFTDSEEFQERAFALSDGREGVDSRGLSKTGRRWRWTGFFGQFAEYHDVSTAAAMYFDAIIDSMCLESTPEIRK
jgi:hypothetical protein